MNKTQENDDGKEKKKRPAEDAFLSTMTFASMQKQDLAGCCDCDECGLLVSGAMKSPEQVIPDPILRAIQAHKRQKGGIIQRTQDRSLKKRDNATNISVWEWTLPANAEPLLEYGTSHRFIWVQQFSPNEKSVIKSIGSGIVGSSAEEKSRAKVEWKEGKIYFVPSNQGRAVGWIHACSDEEQISETTKDDSNQQSQQESINGPVLLVIAKVPPQEMEEEKEEPQDTTKPSLKNEEAHPWTTTICNLCVEYQKQIDNDNARKSTFLELDEASASLLKSAMG